MSWVHHVLSHFDGVRNNISRPETWKARCPAHDDRSPSLSIWMGRKGFLLVRCWAGGRCQLPAILDAAGLTMKDLYPPDTEGPYERHRGVRTTEPKRREVACYDYANEHGEILYQAVRLEPKSFRQRRPLPDGGWAWNLDGVPRVLYRLPDILARPSWPVLVVEGEKDVNALHDIGLLATCNVGGTGMGWRDEYSQVLTGRRVTILPDNDEAGLRHACCVAGSLLIHGAASVRVVFLPNLPAGGDVSDFLARDGKTQLLEVIRSSPEWKSCP